MMKAKKHTETQEKVELPLTQQRSGVVGTKAQLQATLRNEAGGTVFRRHLPHGPRRESPRVGSPENPAPGLEKTESGERMGMNARFF